MIRTVTVTYKGLELECKGYHTPYKSNGWDNPPDSECFEIETVIWNDVDILEVLDALNISWCDLEECCIESLRD